MAMSLPEIVIYASTEGWHEGDEEKVMYHFGINLALASLVTTMVGEEWVKRLAQKTKPAVRFRPR